MSTPTQPTESQPLGDAPELLPVKDIDGMEPYTTFLKRIPQTIFHRRPDDPTILVTLDDRNTLFTTWEMVQIVVSVLHNLPTTLDSQEERNWIIEHFQLREESTKDRDHIVLATNDSVLCYRHEPGDEFVPVTRLDAIGKASYVAHDEAGHDYLKKESTFVIVGSPNHERICPIMDFSRHCPTCIKTAEENRPSTPNWTATVPARKFSQQRLRMLSVGRDDDDDDEEEEEEDLYSWNEAVYYQEPSVASLSRRSSLDSIATGLVLETTVSDMWSKEDGYFDMAPPTILDDDDVPDSQAMLEIENSGYLRRDSDRPNDD
ncbi:hypothetical protein ARMGADRAFT_1103487 [Armillaria gallica]|uniref:Uncharacterized protein n=1 Tax=Armillaria gallica TaxID=47427 RepID=A0A2H3DNG9_ARMGA|nr:hypothetical protein ARMGADRAFT_1103487 [Armillaria gallica]